MNIPQSLLKLSRILPIKNALDALDESTAGTYFTILNGFYTLGRAPFIQELAVTAPVAREHVSLLARQDLLTIDKSGEILGCYPFTMEQRAHRIDLNGHQVYAMCALDALAPASMFNCPSAVSSICAVTSQPVNIKLKNSTVLNADEASDIHVGINWIAASGCGSCSNNLCTEMLYLIDRATAHDWQQQDAANRDIYTLEKAIEFSAGFFKPMLKQN
jgi:mercuric reductase